MNAARRHPRVCALLVLAFLLECSARVSAHRLDEYLQATRVLVGRDRLGLELDLTPGAAVASQVFALIDADGDGAISESEGASYARQVLAALVLEVDAHALSLVLVDSQFPAYREMSAGVGTIRLRAAAGMAASAAGDHQLFYLNDYRPEMSAYLVNALVPEDGQIEMARPRRDAAQHELTLNYRVGPLSSGRSAPSWRLVVGCGLSGLALVALGKRVSSRAWST